MNNKALKDYNTFIERLCKVDFIDTLQVIWGYIRNLQFDKEIPSDIELPPKYDIHKEPNARRSTGIGEWEFDIILLYSILYSPKEIITRYSLKKFSYLRLVVNDIRQIRDEIDKSIIPNKEDVFKEFFRIIHRQFPWQEHINIFYTYRFYKIFSHPVLSSLIKQKTGLSLKELYRTGLLMVGFFNNKFCSRIPMKTEVSWFRGEMFMAFLSFFGITTEDFVMKYKKTITFDESFLYSFNPLRSFPLLIHKNLLYCPIPTYLLWKMTNGIYYDLVNEKGFDNAIGKSFEDYCGLVFEKTFKRQEIRVLQEITFKKGSKKSSDWIFIEDNTLLFIECKVKRLRLESIIRFNDNIDYENDIDKMIGFIFQAYKSLQDALNQEIPNIKIDDASQVYIVILTLEDWHLDLNPYLDRKIQFDLQWKLQTNNFDKAILDKYPYLVRSISLFERDCQIIDKFGLQVFYKKMKSNTLHDLTENFSYYEIFTDEINEELFEIE
jgi:hypothetical protein